MQNIIPFDFHSSEVRVVSIDGEPWFVASDALEILGVDRTSLRGLDEDEKGVDSIHTLGGVQGVTVISESGLYSLILRSRKPEAKTFKRWITHEVIPSIRKTGSYVTPQLTGPALMAAALQEADRTMKELEARASKSETQLDMIEGTSGFSIRQFHKHYFPDVPERAFFELLYRKRLLIDQRGTRGRDEQGKLKNGYEHKHPAAAGKRFFFLDSPYMDQESGRRYYQTKVRPGRPETDLAQLLTSWGLAPNPAHMKEIAA